MTCELTQNKKIICLTFHNGFVAQIPQNGLDMGRR